jgi:hypothetical protein
MNKCFAKSEQVENLVEAIMGKDKTLSKIEAMK